jgi:acetyl esterase/lipase
MHCHWIDPHRPTPGTPWNGPPEDGVAALGVSLAGRARRGAVLVCPGGGYQSIDLHEALAVAQVINQRGMHAFILQYRHWPPFRHPVPYRDALRSVRVIRYGLRGGWWPVDVEKVAILGIGAGGHLAALVATGTETPTAKSLSFATLDDEIESEPSRPDAQVLAYPLIQVSKEGLEGPAGKLVGDHVDLELLQSLDADRRVTARTPPAFVYHRVTEENVTPAFHSLAYGMALTRFNVPLELHCLLPADHGLGLASELVDLQGWPEMAARWLVAMGF